MEIRRSLYSISGSPLSYLFAAFWGVLLGAMIVFLPMKWSLIFLGVMVSILIAAKKPEFALLGILLISSTIFSETVIPTISVGPLQILVTDLIFISLVIFLVFRRIYDKQFKLISSPLILPLLTFYLMGVLATLVAFIRSPGSELTLAAMSRTPPQYVSMSIPEVRVYTYFLLFWVVINCVRTKNQIKILTNGILTLSFFVVMVVLAQEFLGTSIKLIPGRVEQMGSGMTGFDYITRITDFSGEVMLFFALTLSTALFALEKYTLSRFYKIIIWSLYLVGVIITFSRSIWIGYALSMMIFFVIIRTQEKRKLFNLLLTIFIVLLLVVVVGGIASQEKINNFYDAISTRSLSLFNPVTYTSSNETFEWRFFEYQWVWNDINKYPLLGMGLGSEYRPWLPNVDWSGYDGRRFLHNAHAWILVKTGILGYLAFLWFSISYLVRCLKNYKYIEDDTLKGILLGCGIAYLGLLIGSVTSPLFMHYYSTPLIGTFTGLSESVILFNNRNKSVKI